LIGLSSNCQKCDEFEVYALKYFGSRNIPAQEMVVGANPKDSLRICAMVWLLKGENCRNILVDAGCIDTSNTENKSFVRPDIVLQRINVYPSDITDIIMTHPQRLSDMGKPDLLSWLYLKTGFW
jgi:hypothetical protein